MIHRISNNFYFKNRKNRTRTSTTFCRKRWGLARAAPPSKASKWQWTSAGSSCSPTASPTRTPTRTRKISCDVTVSSFEVIRPAVFLGATFLKTPTHQLSLFFLFQISLSLVIFFLARVTEFKRTFLWMFLLLLFDCQLNKFISAELFCGNLCTRREGFSLENTWNYLIRFGCFTSG